MPRVVVIGYGNPLRGDDAIGWMAAQKLADSLNTPDVTVKASLQLTPEMSLLLSEHELAIFIDSREGPEAGKIDVRKIHPQKGEGASVFSHEATPEGLLAQAELLYGRAPKAIVCTMECNDFEVREGLSPEIGKKFPELITTVQNLIFR